MLKMNNRSKIFYTSFLVVQLKLLMSKKIESNNNVGMGKNPPFLVELINEDKKRL